MTIHRLFIFLISVFFLMSVDAKTVDFPVVENNVPYAKISQLSFQKPDKKISYGNSPIQHAQLWYPITFNKAALNTKPLNSKPLIVLIHGGCWLNAFDIQHTYPLATALSQAGYPIWSLEYRRTGDPGGGWPGTFEDILAGIKQLEKYDEPKVNTSNIILLGHSAGGHLALLAAEQLNQSPLKNITIKGTIGLAAITDIQTYSQGKNSCQSATPEFMGGTYTEKKSAYDAANPALKKLPDSVILMQGTADTIVPETQAQLEGVKNVLLPDAGHFDWIHPGSKAFAKLLQTLEKYD